MSKITYKRIKSILKQKSKGTTLGLQYVVEKDLRDNSVITLVCECGRVFAKKFSQIRDQKYAVCVSCAIKYRSANRRKDFDIVFQEIQQAGYKILNPQYINNSAPIEVEDKDGYRGFIYYNKFKTRNSHIVKFSYKFNPKYFIYNLNNYARLNEISAKVIAVDLSLNTAKTGIKCQCACGSLFSTSYTAFQTGVVRCAKCTKSISTYEYKVAQFLDTLNIKYQREYKFNQCKDKIVLPFDFYLTDIHVLIEIDGEGHYFPCHFNQISLDKGIESYNITKKHDYIKNTFCEQYNIPLLRIPYWEIKNSGLYKYKITQFINKYI